MLKDFAEKLSKTSKCISDIDNTIVSLYLDNICNDNVRNKVMINIMKKAPLILKNEISLLLKEFKITLTIPTITKLFELLVPKNDKKINGVYYTQDKIIDFILQKSIDMELLKTKTDYSICDCSSGSGAFLLSAAKLIHENTEKSYKEIFKTNIYGADISPISIRRTKILFTLLAIEHGEDEESFSFNLKVGNSLEFDWKKEFPRVFRYWNGFDLIVGNPPYVRAKNLDDTIKKSIKKWETSNIGNEDLYISFIELGFSLLNPMGKLGYITMNTFFHSLNATKLRDYLTKHRALETIISFGSYQVFENVTSYTCLLFLKKNCSNTSFFMFSPCNHINELNKLNYSKIFYNDLDNAKGWRLLDTEKLNIIKQIEKNGIPLGEKYKIMNGIATLRNNLYIFTPIGENTNSYFLHFQNKIFEIEKAITKNIIKPNVIKDENDLNKKLEKIIFPYYSVDGKQQLINEDELMERYPNTYKYLLSIKKELAQRDKGKKNYPQWYAFGRTQGINIYGKKLLFPYMANKPVFVMCIQEDMLFYCGYCIICDNENELKLLKKILSSQIFWYYLKYVSKDYSSGYKSFAKSYVKNFTIPEINNYVKQKILATESPTDLDDLIKSLYGIVNLP